MKKIILKEINDKTLILDKNIEIASFYSKYIKPFGALGKKHSGYAIQLEKKEKEMIEDLDISAYFPIYATLDKFEGINDLSFELNLNDIWDTGIVAYVICKKDMLKNDLKFKRVSKKKKFSKFRKEEILEFIQDDLLKIKKFYGLNCNVFIKDEFNKEVKIGDIYVKKGFNKKDVIDSIKLNIKETGLLDNVDSYAIELNEEMEDEIEFLKQNFSWTI